MVFIGHAALLYFSAFIIVRRAAGTHRNDDVLHSQRVRNPLELRMAFQDRELSDCLARILYRPLCTALAASLGNCRARAFHGPLRSCTQLAPRLYGAVVALSTKRGKSGLLQHLVDQHGVVLLSGLRRSCRTAHEANSAATRNTFRGDDCGRASPSLDRRTATRSVRNVAALPLPLSATSRIPDRRYGSKFCDEGRPAFAAEHPLARRHLDGWAALFQHVRRSYPYQLPFRTAYGLHDDCSDSERRKAASKNA